MQAFLSAALALAVLMTAASELSAASPRQRYYDPDELGYVQRGFQYGRTPAQCRPWCPRDRNPCDPPQFKIADGRCDPRDDWW